MHIYKLLHRGKKIHFLATTNSMKESWRGESRERRVERHDRTVIYGAKRNKTISIEPLSTSITYSQACLCPFVRLDLLFELQLSQQRTVLQSPLPFDRFPVRTVESVGVSVAELSAPLPFDLVAVKVSS